MAFGNDGKSSDGTRSVAWRWLYEVAFADWGLKLLALAISLGLWYGVTSQRTPGTIRLSGVQLDFLQPDDMEISDDPRDEVDLTLRGSKRALDAINVRDLIVRHDIRQLKPGVRVVRLSPQNVIMDLPEGVEIQKIEPSSIPMRLERRIERELEVKPRFEGTLPEGFRLGNVEVSPRVVRVRGPESHVNAIADAPTESIVLNGQTQNLTLPQTAIDISDPKVVPLETVVMVRVEIGEETVEKSFASVPVRVANDIASARPSTAVILIRGPRSVVENLRAEILSIVLERSPDGALVPRLSLATGFDQRLQLVSTNPAEFNIN